MIYECSEKDNETGLNNFDLRMMDTRLGRWLSVDPMNQNFSGYLAMQNNPVSVVDPSGGLAYAGPDGANFNSPMSTPQKQDDGCWSTMYDAMFAQNYMWYDNTLCAYSLNDGSQIASKDENGNFIKQVTQSALYFFAGKEGENISTDPLKNHSNGPIEWLPSLTTPDGFTTVTANVTWTTDIVYDLNRNGGMDFEDWDVRKGYTELTGLAFHGIAKTAESSMNYTTKWKYRNMKQIEEESSKFLRRAGGLMKGLGVATSVLTTSYSSYKVISEIKIGGITNVNIGDASNATVGIAELAALAFFATNPIGIGIIAGAFIYQAARGAYEVWDDR